MLVVDTTVWVDYFNGKINPETDYLDRAVTRELIMVGDLILVETLQGFREDKDFEVAQAGLARFALGEMIDVFLARQSAQNYRSLWEKRHHRIIATSCIAGNHTLLHRDSDFDGFEKHFGLDVVYAG